MNEPPVHQRDGDLCVRERPKINVQALLDDVTRKLQNGEPLIFATFGDSITFPCYHTDFKQNYVTFTADALCRFYPRANLRIVHVGNIGGTARGLADERFETLVLSHKPDVVFIMFGMNDCAGGAAELEAYEQNLTMLVNKARNAGALAVICTQNEIIYESSDGARRRALPLYMQRALEVAQRQGTAAVDCADLWQPLRQDQQRLACYLNDWIHPNHAGHRLMAKAIVQTLWPEASQFVDTSVRTPPPRSGFIAQPCLLPGPRGKQILRTADGTWCALSGRRYGDHLVDLVISTSRNGHPNWSDFKHVTVIGRDGVFDHLDRQVTAGMLLERDGRVYVLFSWNVGVFMLSVPSIAHEPAGTADHGDPWLHPPAWLAHSQSPFVRPTILENHICGNARLYDAAFQENGELLLMCNAFNMAPTGGWEVLEGEHTIAYVRWRAEGLQVERDYRFPNYHDAGFSGQGDQVIAVAQNVESGQLRLESLHHPDHVVLTGRYDRFIAMQNHRSAILVQDAASQCWFMIKRGGAVSRLTFPNGLECAQPLPWSSRTRNGIVWCSLPPWSLDQPSFAFESFIPPGETAMGVIADMGGQLQFNHMPIDASPQR